MYVYHFCTHFHPFEYLHIEEIFLQYIVQNIDIYFIFQCHGICLLFNFTIFTPVRRYTYVTHCTTIPYNFVFHNRILDKNTLFWDIIFFSSAFILSTLRLHESLFSIENNPRLTNNVLFLLLLSLLSWE